MNYPQPPVLGKAGSGWGEGMLVDMEPIPGGAVRDKRLVLATRLSVALKVGSYH